MTSKQIIQIIKEEKEAEKVGYGGNSFILGYLVSALLQEASDIKRLKKYDYMMGYKKAQTLFDEIMEMPKYEQH